MNEERRQWLTTRIKCRPRNQLPEPAMASSILLLQAAVALTVFRISGSLLIDRGAVPLVVAAVELMRVLVPLRNLPERVRSPQEAAKQHPFEPLTR